MKLKTYYLKNNNCYKAGKPLVPRGIMIHSTGANNPSLARYVGPDDGALGPNRYQNHWNTPKPGGREVCPHAFMGKLKDGSIAVYQTLPWNVRGWHAGGKANDTHIGFEICEDGLTDRGYFQKTYDCALELCALLCRQYGLSAKDVICHAEGHARGIASNHGDVLHWWSRHGKSMDTFRAELSALLQKEKSAPKGTAEVTYTVCRGDTLWTVAKRFLGKGSRYAEIMSLNGLKSTLIRPGMKLLLPKK